MATLLRPRWRSHIQPVFVAVVIALVACNARATTIMQVDFDYLLRNAKLVIEAEVIARQSKMHSNGRSVYTRVTFRINDVIKGDYSLPTITLDFAGGTLGERGTAAYGMD